MIPRFRQRLSAEEWSRLLLSGDPGALARFEDGFAAAFGYRHALWLPYGRDAVRCALETLADLTGVVSEQRKVALGAFNCVALGNGVVSAGWRPSYLDTGVGSFQADPVAFLQTVGECRAGIHVSAWGESPDESFLRSAGVPIVHDRCLATLGHPPPDFAREEDSAVYSFGWGKPLGLLRGGMLCGQSARFHQKWKQWRDSHVRRPASRVSELKDLSLLAAGLHPLVFALTMKAEGLASFRRLTGRDAEAGLEAAVGSGQWLSTGHFEALEGRLANLAQARAERAAQIDAYFRGLEGVPGLLLPARCATLSHFPVRLERREPLRIALLNAGIHASDRLFAKLLPDHPHLAGPMNGGLPNARQLCRITLHLPLHPGLGLDEIGRISAILKETNESFRD